METIGNYGVITSHNLLFCRVWGYRNRLFGYMEPWGNSIPCEGYHYRKLRITVVRLQDLKAHEVMALGCVGFWVSGSQGVRT